MPPQRTISTRLALCERASSESTAAADSLASAALAASPSSPTSAGMPLAATIEPLFSADVASCQSADAAWRNSRDDHELLALLTSDFAELVGPGRPPLDFESVAAELRDEEADASGKRGGCSRRAPG